LTNILHAWGCLDALENAFNCIQPLVQYFNGRAERQADEVMTRRLEQIAAMSRIDIEEDSWDNDRLLRQEFFKEGLKKYSQPQGKYINEREMFTSPLLRGGGRLSRLSQM